MSFVISLYFGKGYFSLYNLYLFLDIFFLPELSTLTSNLLIKYIKKKILWWSAGCFCFVLSCLRVNIYISMLKCFFFTCNDKRK